MLNELYKFQQKHPNIYIGGSIALILQEAIPYREIKDVDLITKDKIYIYDIFETSHRYKHVRTKVYNNIRYELFRNPNAQFVEFPYKNSYIKISPVNEVLQWKLKYLDKPKHFNDVQNIYSSI